MIKQGECEADSEGASEYSLSDARILFISDIHLGSRFSQVGRLIELLDQCLPQSIYIVGDLLDNRRLTKRIRWTADYTRLLVRLFDLAASGTSIYYTPGNHDTFLRQFAADFRMFQIRDSFFHTCVDGRRLAVLHGDQFDGVEQRMKWLSLLGSTAYEGVLAADRSLNWCLSLATQRRVALSRSLKRAAKRVVQQKSGFHEKVVQFATSNDCDGVVCGHIHHPEIRRIRNTLYCNTGDWIEHCTAMVEWPSGELELIRASELPGASRGKPLLHRLRNGRLRKSRRDRIATTA